MLKIGTGELLVILFVALIIFGPSKLPELGKYVGTAVRNFRKYSDKLVEEINEEIIKPMEDSVAPVKDAVKPLEDITKPFEELKKAL